MVFGRLSNGICFLMLVMLMLMVPIETSRVPQYGLDSVVGFCEGWGDLDQLSDISSQMLNVKYPYMGPIRVS